MIMFSSGAYSKTQKGIYLSSSDFTGGKLSYAANSKVHINNSVFDMTYVTVTENGNKIKLKKSDIYGFVDDKNTTHRFYNGEEYVVEENGNIFIYSKTEKVAQSKGYKLIKKFCFSTSPSGDIISLNIENLRNAYKSNAKFLDLVDQYFSNGIVTDYDNIRHAYKVNYVYNKAQK